MGFCIGTRMLPFIYFYLFTCTCIICTRKPAMYTPIHKHLFIYLFIRLDSVSGYESMHPFMDAFIYLFYLFNRNNACNDACPTIIQLLIYLFISLITQHCASGAAVDPEAPAASGGRPATDLLRIC